MNKKINFSSKGIKYSVEIEVNSIKKKIESIIGDNLINIFNTMKTCKSNKPSLLIANSIENYRVNYK